MLLIGVMLMQRVVRVRLKQLELDLSNYLLLAAWQRRR